MNIHEIPTLPYDFEPILKMERKAIIISDFFCIQKGDLLFLKETSIDDNGSSKETGRWIIVSITYVKKDIGLKDRLVEVSLDPQWIRGDAFSTPPSTAEEQS